MKVNARVAAGTTLVLAAVLSPHVAAAETLDDTAGDFLTVQSELDYLRAAKLPLTLELKHVTARRALDAVARKAGIRVSFEGKATGETTRDVAFRNVCVKDVLARLAEEFGVWYRVDGPDALTVIVAEVL